MKMINELRPLYLYSAGKKFYAPINVSERRKGAAILLLSPNLDTSAKMIQLPYMYNPGLFSSFFIDRNITAYISDLTDEDVNFDEKEEESLSESLVSLGNSKITFEYDNDVPVLVKRHCYNIFNSNVAKYLANKIGLKDLPKKLFIKVHNNLNELSSGVDYKDLKINLFSYTKDNVINIIPKSIFNEREFGGEYDIYLATELLNAIILNANPKINKILAEAIAAAVSGRIEWVFVSKETKVLFTGSSSDLILKYGKIFYNILNSDRGHDIGKLILTNDTSILTDEIRNETINSFKATIYGYVGLIKSFLPEKRVNEATVITEDDPYNDILSICKTLSEDEMKKISFYPEYRNSQFVIKRIIHKINDEPAGFLDVYQFPSKPEIAQITLAVNSNYRHMGIADSMVKEMLDSNLESEYGFSTYWWTAHPENIGSQKTALKNGFINTDLIDKYGRMVFIKPVKAITESSEIPAYTLMKKCPVPELEFGEYGIQINTENRETVFNEVNDEAMYSKRIRKFLYIERLKNKKQVMEEYDKIRPSIPMIKRMYPKIEMYKRFNLFVDTSYYHAIFLRKNKFKRDRAVNFYFNFLNRLLNNPDVNDVYKTRTIFIPIDSGIWNEIPGSDITDWRTNLNPISIFFRLVRTNLPLLRKEWGNKTIIFVGSRGYFTIDFSTIEFKNLQRIKRNLTKLRSSTEKIEDEYEVDDDDTLSEDEDNTNSSKATALKIIDTIENKTGIEINNASQINNISKQKVSAVGLVDSHMKISSKIVTIKDSSNPTLVISIDNDVLTTNSPLDIKGFNKYYSED